MSDVVLLKLSNGMDVMAKVVAEDDTLLLLSKPRMIAYEPAGHETRVGFIPFLIAAENNDVPLAKAHIMVHMKAPHKIEEGYRQATSPIQLATAMPRGGQTFEGKPN